MDIAAEMSTLKRRHGRINLKGDDDESSLLEMDACCSVPASVSSPNVIGNTRQASLPINPTPRHLYRSFESDDEDIGNDRGQSSRPERSCQSKPSTPSETLRRGGFGISRGFDMEVGHTLYSTTAASRWSPDDMEDMSTSNIIHTLPNELLTLIFEAGSALTYPSLCEPKSPYVPITVKKITPFMTTVMHVCHRWRQVAIHTPALWTTLHVSRSKKAVDKLPNIKDFRNPIAWVTEHLTRSQSLPLDISIDCRNLSAKTVFAQLTPESNRWRSLRITLTSVQELPTALTNLKKVSAPLLETLEITSLKYHDSISPPITSFFRNGLSPRLAHVRLNRVNLSWLAFPLKDLTTLELRFVVWPTYPLLADMLSGSPNLESLLLHIDNTAAKLLERHTRPSISIPSLKSLEIRLFSQGQPTICPFLQIFSIPALESLTMRDVTSSDWCRILVYFRVHCTSYPVLRHLTLSSIKGLISVDSSAVRAFPQLTTLSLAGLYANAFFRLLVDEKTDDMYRVPVWPNLGRVVVAGDPSLNVALVNRAVEARRTMGRAIVVCEERVGEDF
ncbi:hypothetical protein CPB85DRAFT_1457083 [Mucidula mucida]|nr:hypothetical protein CPB85DRAFT_1457083 [Mucidula mucida]